MAIMRNFLLSTPTITLRSLLALAVSSLLLAACATPPRQATTAPAPEPEQAATQPPVTDVYFYPKAGQSPEQQERDRYECYLWAKQQTGFDPSSPELAPHQRVQVVPQPAPGHDTATGAVTGAVIGAVVSRPRDRVGGAVVGAMVGGALGAASDASRQREAARIQQGYDRAEAERSARLERQASEYRRAMAACLEGRGYAVHE